MTEQRRRSFSVYGPGLPGRVVVRAHNWVFALGSALERVESRDWISRLCCEIHPDGTVLANDEISGLTYVVRPLSGESAPRVSVNEQQPQGSGETDPGTTPRS